MEQTTYNEETKVRPIGERLATDLKGFNMVAQTDDMAYVLRDPNGQYVFLDEKAGYSSSDPKMVEAAIASASTTDKPTPGELVKNKAYKDIVSQAPGTARLLSIARGMPYVGEYSDEGLQSLDDMFKAVGLSDTPSGDIQRRANVLSSAFAKTSPGEDLALRTTGAIGGSYLMGKAVGGVTPLADKIANFPGLQKFVANVLVGMGVSVPEGFIYGSGRGTDMESRIKEGQSDVLFSAIGGGTGRGVVGLVGDLVPYAQKGFTQIKNLVTGATKQSNVNPIKVIQQTLNVDKDTASVIAKAIEDDMDITDALDRMVKAGDLGMIADADPVMQVLTDVSVQMGGGRQIIQANKDRLKQLTGETKTQLDQGFGKVPKEGDVPFTIQEMAQQINKTTKQERVNAYQNAYKHFVDYGSESGQKIIKTLNRADDNLINKAIKEANAQLKFDDMPNFQIKIKLNADGDVIGFDKNLNMVQLDYIKRALQASGQEVDQIGMKTPDARRAMQLAYDLKGALVKQNPAYGEALNIASNTISLRNYLNMGKGIFGNKVEPRDVMLAVKHGSKSEINMMKLGARKYIDDLIANTKAVNNQPELAITQLQKVKKEFSSENARRKLKMILGDDESKALFDKLDQVQIALELNTAVAQNSKTATRQAIKEEVEAQVDQGIYATTLGAKTPLEGAMNVVNRISGATKEYSAQERKRVFKQIANAMTKIKGKPAREALKRVYDAIKAGQDVDANIQRASALILEYLPVGQAAGRTLGRENLREQ